MHTLLLFIGACIGVGFAIWGTVIFLSALTTMLRSINR